VGGNSRRIPKGLGDRLTGGDKTFWHFPRLWLLLTWAHFYWKSHKNFK